MAEAAAEKRMLAGKKADPPVNLPEGKGDARDQVAEQFGVSGKASRAGGQRGRQRKTSEVMAKEFGVNERTIRRDAKPGERRSIRGHDDPLQKTAAIVAK